MPALPLHPEGTVLSSLHLTKVSAAAGLTLALLVPSAFLPPALSPTATAAPVTDDVDVTPVPSPASPLPSDPSTPPLASIEPSATAEPNAATQSPSPEDATPVSPQSASPSTIRTPTSTHASFRVSQATRIGNGWTGLDIFTAGPMRPEGDNDLVRVTDTGQLMIYRRSTPTSFSSAQVLGQGWANMLHRVGGIDFDGDGTADLIAVNPAGEMILYRGNGAGRFSYSHQIGSGWATASHLVTVSQGPGGKPAIYAQFDSTVRVYTTNGKGSWTGWDTVSLPGGNLSNVVASRDVTGGGISTLLRAHGSSVEFLHSTTGMQFTSAGTIDTGLDLNHLVGTTGFGSYRSGTVDLIDQSNVLYSLPLTYTGGAPTGPTTPTPTPTPGLYPWASDLSGSYLRQSGQGWGSTRVFAMGDTTATGYPDLGLITGDGDFLLYEGQSNHSFRYPDTIGRGWSRMLHVITGIDFDGDTRMDVLAVSPDGILRIYRTNSGRFTTSSQIGNGWTQFQRVWAARNGDNGNPVLYALAPSGTMFAYPTNGQGGFLSPVTLNGNFSYLTDAASVDDWDKDGRSDFLSIANDGTLLITRQSSNYNLSSPQAIGQGWGSLRVLLAGQVNASSQTLYAIHSDRRLLTYRFNYSGGNRNFHPVPTAQTGGVPQQSNGWRILPIEWAGQPTDDTCGPTSMFMALRYMGANRSAYDGSALSISALAGPNYAAVGSGWSGGTSWEDSRLSVGMNRWLGKNVYRQQSFPTGPQLRNAVTNMFSTNRPVLVDTIENYGGPHYNGHFNGYSSHIIVAYRYHTNTGVVGFKDPGGPGSALRGYSASREFDYNDVERFAVNFLGNYGGGGHGMVY